MRGWCVFVKVRLKPADLIFDAPELCRFDRRMFPAADCFNDPKDWEDYLVFWIVAENQDIGSTAFGLNLRIGENWESDSSSPGNLWIASIGILPEFRGEGIGKIAIQLIIDWARNNRFTNVASNCRASNKRSIHLHQNAGFIISSEIPDYYKSPKEAATVFNLLLWYFSTRYSYKAALIKERLFMFNNNVGVAGIGPATSPMWTERSTTELNARRSHNKSKRNVLKECVIFS